MTSQPSVPLMNQLLAAVTELHTRLPSFPCRVLAYRECVPNGLFGVYVSLSGPSAEHVVGLLAAQPVWELLAELLDRDRPRSEARSVVEGGCELARAVAEAFRATLPDAECVVGLPLFAEGMVSGDRRLELQVTDVSFGGHPVLVVLFTRAAGQQRRLSSAPRVGAHGDAA